MTFESFSIELLVCKSEALTAIERATYELLILDVSLPDGNGFEVCEKTVEKGMPVIFLASSGDERSAVNGFNSGAYDYISKPFRPLELLSQNQRNLYKKLAEASGRTDTTLFDRDCMSFINMIEKREAQLSAMYPNDKAFVNELVTRLIIERVTYLDSIK